MNGAGGCSLATSGWSRAAPLAAARAGAAASRSPQTPGSFVAGRPRPPCPRRRDALSAAAPPAFASAPRQRPRPPRIPPPARAERPLLGAGYAALPPSSPGSQALAGRCGLGQPGGATRPQPSHPRPLSPPRPPSPGSATPSSGRWPGIKESPWLRYKNRCS
ncbi:PREDICTED: atherin-like [Rhinopithecus bieti]|uniref:atherin-like n=1 Tax=Rhinopithecus bieti TaxID=61621 RepID=UPI00083C6922|nr:PREDICTED: atherin-like [Rhinopithecus bieti]